MANYLVNKEQNPAQGSTPTYSPGPAPEGTGYQLWLAAFSGQVAKVQALCERWGGHGEVISWANPDNGGWTPLHAAYGSPQMTAILLSTPGCEVNKGDNNGETPLWKAAYWGKPETVQALLKAPGIDLNKAPTGGRYIGKSPLTIARDMDAEGWEGCQEVVRLLEGAGAVATPAPASSGETKGGTKKRKSTKKSKKTTKKNSKKKKSSYKRFTKKTK